MQQRLLIMLALVMGATTIAPPQGGGGGGFQRRTPEERTAAIHFKLDSAYKLEAKTFAILDSALNTLHRNKDKKVQEMMAGGLATVDREPVMAERQKWDN